METLIRLQISSPAFKSGEQIPQEFTCDGQNIRPALEISELPSGTKSLALIVEDPDAPTGNWVHWLAWDILPTNRIEKGNIEGTQGKNDFGNLNYGGPCPPLGTHRYYFRVYALDTFLRLPTGNTKEELMQSMSYHILGSGELMGLYSR
jgi:Raf kinase inhibitor-like YbhB/YbcL family protein